MRAVNCLVPWRIHRQIFLLKVQSTWTNTSGFEQSVQVRTDAKSESDLTDGFPSMNISAGRDPYTVFTSFLVYVLLAGYYPVLITDPCILIC